MISTHILSQPDLVDLDLKRKLSNLYQDAGIPVNYHFKNLETDWSRNYSPSGTLTGTAKKRSQDVYNFINGYITALDSIVAGQGLKVKLKNSVKIITDLILDGSKSSGKTLLMSLIAQEAINRGHSVKYVEWAEYCDRFLTFEARGANEDFFSDCLYCDILIFDNLYQYEVSNNKFFIVQLDRLISSRMNKGKVTICSIDTINNQNPAFGFIWNKFSRETFTFKLPEANIKNENKSKRS
jgi:DNA replication protein DnaC